jgi:hypothetical protein
MPVISSDYRCDQLFNLIKNVKSRTRTRLTDDHLHGYMRIATEIKRDSERLLKQKHCQMIMTDFVKETY